MRIINSVQEMKAASAAAKQQGQTIGFVPTMGALHQGHLSLVEMVRGRTDLIVMSVFVNPTQFNSTEDFQRYPLTLEQDIASANKCGVDILFVPQAGEIYPAGATNSLDEKTSCFVKAGSLSAGFCGAGRPGHFDGVVTVVGILFNIVQPHVAVFGEKDYQQLAVIRQLVSDLQFNVDIVAGVLVRDSDGLALSSRNLRLTAEDRYHALFLPRSLFKAQEMVKRGERSVELLKEALWDNLTKSGGLEVEYVEIVDPESLQVLQTVDTASQLLVAVHVGGVRLIDNVRLE